MGHRVRQRCSGTVSKSLHPIKLHLQGGCLQSLICSECNWKADFSLKTRFTELFGYFCHTELGEHLENKIQMKYSTAQ